MSGRHHLGTGPLVTASTPLLFATLCEGNTIKNSAAGFDLNGTFAFAIRGTTYENCPKGVNDRGYDTAILPGTPEAMKGEAVPRKTKGNE